MSEETNVTIPGKEKWRRSPLRFGVRFNCDLQRWEIWDRGWWPTNEPYGSTTLDVEVSYDATWCEPLEPDA